MDDSWVGLSYIIAHKMGPQTPSIPNWMYSELWPGWGCNGHVTGLDYFPFGGTKHPENHLLLTFRWLCYMAHQQIMGNGIWIWYWYVVNGCWYGPLDVRLPAWQKPRIQDYASRAPAQCDESRWAAVEMVPLSTSGSRLKSGSRRYPCFLSVSIAQ